MLLEACLQNFDGYVVIEEYLKGLASSDSKTLGNWNNVVNTFTTGKVVLQDFNGVPAVVVLAAMRAAMNRMPLGTSDPKKVSRTYLAIW